MIADVLSDACGYIKDYQADPFYDDNYADLRPWIDGVRAVMNDLRFYLDTCPVSENIERVRALLRSQAEAGLRAYLEAMAEVRREVDAVYGVDNTCNQGAALKAGATSEVDPNLVQ